MSTLFNLSVPKKEKPVSKHPWQSTIKDVYANKIKYAHNSIRNPYYPQKKVKVPDKNRVKFTIIGDRITREFIYCTALVRGLRKYRSKMFDEPVIRGVTTVEWPEILHELKLRYGGLTYCLESPVAVLYNDSFLGGVRELKQLVDTKYIYHLLLNYPKESIAQFANYVKSTGRSFAYLHISIDGEAVGTLIFMLYNDIVPNTCNNFLRLCESRKGGYGGTPVHRIVKDGWIQCGGFGLKDTPMDCENFIIPHDRRGVLCMCNDGRNKDCSTQFFVLLQPAPWMAFKYVAFGQLVDGKHTLERIENVPTWYESPKSKIIIYQAGVLNLDCQGIIICKGIHEYLESHVEDLIFVGQLFTELLMEHVWLEIEFRRISKLEQIGEGEGEEATLRATQRFLRKKEDIQRALEKSKSENRTSSSAASRQPDVNNDFDVSVYEYEPEEYTYQHVTPVTSDIVKEKKPYYLPLTDVPYPNEVDSTYDLKKFLRGDYCLESDLETDRNKMKKEEQQKQLAYMKELIEYFAEVKQEEEESSEMDSDDEREIAKFMKTQGEQMSLAGPVIRNIAKAVDMGTILENLQMSQLITDEELRRLRIAAVDLKTREFKKVRIAESTEPDVPHHASGRRPTGFVRPQDIEDSDDDNEDMPRQSVLKRLYDDVTYDDDENIAPTLKDYKPASETHKRSILLTFSPLKVAKSSQSIRDKYARHSLGGNESYEQLLNLQHGKKVSRKISSDYVKTIDIIERRGEHSIRSLEYAKTRPTLSVNQYQQKNQKYLEEKLNINKPKSADVSPVGMETSGLRLPGDTPLFLSKTNILEALGSGAMIAMNRDPVQDKPKVKSEKKDKHNKQKRQSNL